MKAVLEGLLFISGDEGLSLSQIKDVLEINDQKLNNLITDLSKDYEDVNRGIKIDILGNKIKLVTKKEHKEYYQKLIETDSDTLSQSSLETLAIIAYNQPIVRSRIDEIRGVDSSYVLRKLLLKNLIEEKGHSDLPGRPILYGTTDFFLDHFGLKKIEELPKIEEKENNDEEVNLFSSKYKEELDKI